MTKTLLVHLPYPVIKDTITVEAGVLIIWKTDGFERIRNKRDILSLVLKNMITEAINIFYRIINNNIDNKFYYRAKRLRK